MYYTILEELDDMLPEYFIMANNLSKRYSTGLFMENVCFADVDKEKYFTTKTAYKNAMDIVISIVDGSEFNLFDAFHEYCFFYLQRFILNESNNGIIWTPGFLLRKNMHEPLVHAFAYRFLEDGRCLYADARGVTDDISVFFGANAANDEDYFKEFDFSKKDCYFLLKESSFRKEKYSQFVFELFDDETVDYTNFIKKKYFHFLEKTYSLFNEKMIAM